MAETEMRVKVTVAGDPAKNLEAIKVGFRNTFTQEQADNMRVMGRHFLNMERELKELFTSVSRGDAYRSVAATVAIFTGGALAVKAAIDMVRGSVNLITSQAKAVLDIADQARRIGIHPAQLQAEINVGLRSRISREATMQIVQEVFEKTTDLKNKRPGAWEPFYQGLEGDPQALKFVTDWVNRVVAAPQHEQLNLIKEGADNIRETLTNVFHDPARGELEAERWLRVWTGTIELEKLRDKYIAVSEEDKALMDKTIAASQSWAETTAKLFENFEAIKRLLTIEVARDPVLGALVKLVNWGLVGIGKGLEAEQKRMDEGPSIVWPFGPGSIQRWQFDLLLSMLGGALGTRRREEGTEAQPQRLLGGEWEKNLDYTAQLITQLRRFNALLSGQEKKLSELSPAFHNAPQGGAEGESNPVQLPSDASQPGGGAAAEARSDPVIGPSALSNVRMTDRPWWAQPAFQEEKPTTWWTYGVQLGEAGVRAFEESQAESENVQRRQQLRQYGIRRPEWEKGGSMGWQQRAAASKQLEASQANAGEMAKKLGIEDVAQLGLDLPPREAAPQQAEMRSARPPPMTVTGTSFAGEQQRAQQEQQALLGQPGAGKAILTAAEAGAAALANETPSQRAARIFQQREFAGETPDPTRPEASGRAIPSAPTFVGGVLGMTDEQYREALTTLFPYFRATKIAGQTVPEIIKLGEKRSYIGSELRKEREESKLGAPESEYDVGEAGDINRSSLDRGMATDLGIDAIGNLDVHVNGNIGKNAPEVDVRASGDGMFANRVQVARYDAARSGRATEAAQDWLGEGYSRRSHRQELLS